MTLARALALLPSRPESDEDVVAIMAVLARHPGEAFCVEDLSRRTGIPCDRAKRVLDALSAALVLDCTDVGSYRYERDVAVELELRSLSDRLRAHREHLQGNVVRFRLNRDRY
ncbi:MAG: hypothetical protein N3B11_00880 [Coriobacteriia bacterium]|nr:hypothetical protein [Coriobacteriia bacterium]